MSIETLLFLQAMDVPEPKYMEANGDGFYTVYTGADMPEPDPVVQETVISAEAFRRRFTDAEMLMIIEREKTNNNIALMLLKLQTNQSGIDLNDPASTIAMLGYLASLGILSADRVNQIRAI
jgi:hypothetical protein